MLVFNIAKMPLVELLTVATLINKKNLKTLFFAQIKANATTIFEDKKSLRIKLNTGGTFSKQFMLLDNLYVRGGQADTILSYYNSALSIGTDLGYIDVGFCKTGIKLSESYIHPKYLLCNAEFDALILEEDRLAKANVMQAVGRFMRGGGSLNKVLFLEGSQENNTEVELCLKSTFSSIQFNIIKIDSEMLMSQKDLAEVSVKFVNTGILMEKPIVIRLKAKRLHRSLQQKIELAIPKISKLKTEGFSEGQIIRKLNLKKKGSDFFNAIKSLL